jgi:APA family basic amino acid/polyamine antiporter
MIPSTGGDFDYLRRAYGDLVGFAQVWQMFWIRYPAILAIQAIVFGDYIVRIFVGIESDQDTYLSKFCAISLVVTLTVLNFAGVRQSAIIVDVLTFMKVIIILIIFLAGVIYACDPSHSNSLR